MTAGPRSERIVHRGQWHLGLLSLIGAPTCGNLTSAAEAVFLSLRFCRG
jgi:hypothetical protein